MIALIQRVNSASIQVNKKTISQINDGLCVFLCIDKNDEEGDISYIIKKLENITFFKSKEKHFELNLKTLKHKEILLVSQFTLCANLNKGNKPSFSNSKNPKDAKILFDKFTQNLIDLGYTVKTGIFGEYMQVALENDGPATFIINSDGKNKNSTK